MNRFPYSRVLIPLVVVALWMAGMAPCALAADGGGSVYPIGSETVMPGMAPPPGGTMFLEFEYFYQANKLTDSEGRSQVPGFHLRVAAFAVKLVHNWGVHALGGTLVSSVGAPLLYEHLTAPFGRGDKTGIGNIDIGVLSVTFAKKDWHWWYGVDAFTPGTSYTKGDLLNVGQHNLAYSPVGAFTYLSDKGRTEISSKVQYIVNRTNPATQYRSGHEFIWEYDGMRQLSKKVAIGANGYFLKQTTDDRQSGLIVGDGNRGRIFSAGPEVRCHLGRVEVIAKYQKEMLAQNKTSGNGFWLQFGVPLWHVE